MGQAPIRRKQKEGEIKLGGSPGKTHLYFQRIVPERKENGSESAGRKCGPIGL